MGEDRLVGRRIGGFELLAPIGSGAFATVYRARQLSLGRDVALKILDPLVARNPDAARRFAGEGQKAAGLDHPAIVPVYEAGEDEGLYYLAMRLVAGNTLATELADGMGLPTARLPALVRALAEALDHAHAAGVIHRDVKPANVLLSGDRTWLSDFGIAATAQSAGQYTTGAIGTGEYMAPEQARPGEIDGRADLYSLTCVVFECLAGHPPFQADDLVGLLYEHAHAPVPIVGDAALDAFFARGMAKDRAERFGSGAELADALDAALGVGDATVRPSVVGRGSGGRRWRRPRRRVVVGALVLAGMVIVTGLVVTHRNQSPRCAAGPATSARVGTVELALHLRGPIRVRDPHGATYELPDGWEVGGHNVSPGLERTLLRRAGTDAVLIEVRCPDDDPPQLRAAQGGIYPPCTGDLQRRDELGGVSAIRCQFRAAGATSSPPEETTVYYVTGAHQAWMIAIKRLLPTEEATRFATSWRLTA